MTTYPHRRRAPRPHAAIGRLVLVVATSASCVLMLSALAPPGRAAAATPYASQLDIVYGTASGQQLLMDAYIPSGTGPFPAVIVIHGGGWWSGSKTAAAAPAKFLARNGFAAFAIDYRLAPKYPFPAATDDAQTAIRFVRQNAARFNVDPARIGVAGSSAGGQIAGYVATVGTGKLDVGARVCAAVTWSGPMDFPAYLTDNLTPHSLGHGYFRPTATMSLLQVLRAASPITYVDPSDPPMFLSNAQHEQVPLIQAKLMVQALDRAHIPDRLDVLAGSNHALHGPNFQEVLPPSVAFLQQHLRDCGRARPGGGPSTSPSSPPGGSSGGPGSTIGDVHHGRPVLVWALVALIAAAVLVSLGAVLYRWRAMSAYRR